MTSLEILGVRVDNLTKAELITKIQSFLAADTMQIITTPNPEIILKAQKNLVYRQALNAASLAVLDGFGLQIAAAVKGQLIPRITGADLCFDLLRLANDFGLRVALAHKHNALSSADEISWAVQKLFPKLSFAVFEFKDFKVMNENLLNFQPQIIFCDFGAPEQELFFADYKSQLIFTKIGIGIGGSFDFITNKLPRAPKVMQRLGLEWLFRLHTKPQHFKRVLRAVIVFPFKFIISLF